MKIAFVYTKGRPPAWKDRSFDLQNFGGSEGSMIRFAKEFVKLGHEVSIYTEGAKTQRLYGVEWLAFDESSLYDKYFDVVISMRFPNAFAVEAGLRVLYATDPQIHDLQLRDGHGLIDLVIVISEHQKQRFQEEHPIDDGKYLVSNAGIVYDDYARTGIPKVPGRCFYCSVADRGLTTLGSIWTAIHRELPWATLHVTGGYSLWGLDISLNRRADLIEILTLPGVSYLGVVSRERLVEEQLQSQVLLIPGNPGSPEMCCMAAMECAAAGNVLIVGDIAALPERVIEGKTGYAVKHEGGWHKVFAQKAIEALTHPHLKAMQTLARETERVHDYSVLAPKWVTRFEEELDARR